MKKIAVKENRKIKASCLTPLGQPKVSRSTYVCYFGALTELVGCHNLTLYVINI